MDTLAAFDLIEAVEAAIEAGGRYGDAKEKTRRFLTALHERGLSIVGNPRPASNALCCEVKA